MKRKAQVTWKLLMSFLLFTGLLGTAMWLLLALPAQAAEKQPRAIALAPTSVTVAGSLQSELGCPGDWQPECVTTHLTDVGYGIWRGVFDVPTGSYDYKMTLDDGWSLAYPSSNKSLVITGSPTETIKFYFDDKTKSVLDSSNDQVAVAAGSFQNELGCPGDWQPECVATLLTDPNGDGIYTFISRDIPAGSYDFKVALDENWTTSYPAGNVSFSVNSIGEQVTIIYDTSNNDVTVNVSGPISITLVGSLQSELGCTDMGAGAGGDWEPACSQTHLSEIGNGVWRGIFDLPTGNYDYKMALDDSWTVSYPGDNKTLTVTTSPTETVAFYYDHKTNAVIDNINNFVVTAVGDFQIALGCEADWTPACVRSLMSDTDGDGVYTFTTNGLPAGNYNAKVALDEAWDISYPIDNVPFTVTSGGEQVIISYDTSDNAVSVRVGLLPPIDLNLVKPAVQHAVQDEIFYFALTDRFQDGDPGNNTGGITGTAVDHGYDPTDISYFHGGDLAGLVHTDTLDYIEGLGISAIWITPVFENQPTQPDSGATNGTGAAYHGYWILSYEDADPHLGTDQELQDFITAAHARGIKVYFDFVANHTADVISYVENQDSYRNKTDYPYRDENGVEFNDRDYVYSDTFPVLSTTVSFPYTPEVAPADANLKKPAWLNNPIYYHNRGNSTFAGESSEYGDFFGLDDTFTEHPDVLTGFTNIMTGTIAAYGIDGFRIDTVKHVNIEFWEQSMPVVMDYAVNNGKPDFFIFGEVFDGNVETLSRYTTEGNLPGVLDFGLHGAAINFAVNSGETDNLRNFFASDDYFTDADSNAYQLGTFVSNHDGAIERVGGRLRDLSGTTDAELVDRMSLAYGLLYFGRGFPVVYYGDEQGFVGSGSDKLAREDMFPSQVAAFNSNDLIGTADTTADDNLDNTHPIYLQLSDFAAIYNNNLALRRGAQIHRYSTNGAGIYAFSRIERNEKVEYIVALNNAESQQTASFEIYAPNMGLTAVYPPAGSPISSDASSMVTVTVPALDFVIYKADAPLPAIFQPEAISAAPDITFNSPAAGAEVTGKVEVGVDLSADIFAEVNFAVSIDGGAYSYLGTDNNAPYRIFYDTSGLAVGTELTFQAIVNDLNGDYKNNIVSAVVGQSIIPGDESWAIIHYNRPAGDYGDYSSNDFNDFWGLHLWGDAIADNEATTWDSPKKFAGFDDFGAFVAIELKDPTKPVNFIIHRGGDKDTPNDRSFDPSVTSEIWLMQGDVTNYASRAEATDTTIVHYNRPDTTYTDWNLYLWQDDWNNDWNISHPYDGMNDFGAVYTITTSTYPSLTVTSPLNYIMHNGGTQDPDPGSDRNYTPSEQYEIWLHSGVITPSLSLAEANNTAVFHYARCLNDFGDYNSSDFNDFWGLHTWGGATDPGWTTPRKATGFDDFGVYFEVPLFDDATELNYIFHRGDEKDTPANQSLNLNTTGHEIWVINGDVVDVNGIRRQNTSEPIAYAIKEQICAGSVIGNIEQQQAYWLSENTIGWDPLVAADEVYLHAAPTGGLVLDDTGISGGTAYTLTQNGTITGPIAAKFPHLAGLAAWELAPADAALAADLLTGQIAVSAFAGDALVDATGLQIPGVLDDLYAADASAETLGVVWAGNLPTLNLWAPTAKSVTLHLFADANPATPSVTETMTQDAGSGIWRVTGDSSWKNQYYLYEVEVYIHSTGMVEHNLVTDPYSFSLAMNSTRSQIVDLEDAALAPAGWDTLAKPALVNPEDITIYEIHMRDFSVNDPLVPAEAQGTFKAFTYPNSNGMQHLQALADAGLSHLHLLPVFDIATINEDKTTWEDPDFTGADMSSASEDQQAAVTAVENTDAFNWGYDPFHYTVPEGSYSTVPTGTQRIVEFREMVQAINQTDLRVVMDVVYNHTNASGQNQNSVLDKVVPGYYHRLNASGQVETSTCCENTATEHDMMEKLMVDSLVTWAKEYKVDAFRFDLMGHHMKDNMLAVRAALDALTLEDDGVDGQSIYLYGEGWNFGEVANDARGVNATQLNMAGTGIGTFSDRLRDAVRGPSPFASGADLMTQGFANGLYYDPNNHPQTDSLNRLLLLSDQIRVGLAGNLADYEFIDRNGDLVTGAEVDYNGQPAGYTADPQEHIVYISKHDNQTLYDINAFAIPTATTTMTDRVRVQQMGLSIVSLSQGVPFYQAGSDLLRSKSMDRDSYNSGDWFNTLDFTYASNNWGVGLPVAGKNMENWDIMRPFLSDPALMPDQADIMHSADLYQEWLAIRASSPLFRLETAVAVQARLSYENVGQSQIPGLIVMNLSDVANGVTDIDPNYDQIVVLFNANDEAQTISSTNWIDQELVLHPIQAASVDEVVKQTTFDAPAGEFTIPGRTTAVFVVEQVVEIEYGVELSPATASQEGMPSETVTYTLTLTNTGNVTDTFTLAIADNVWPVTFPASVTLEAGMATTIEVTVNIPSDALDEAADSVTVTATSDGDPLVKAESSLTTTVNNPTIYYYFPIIFKE